MRIGAAAHGGQVLLSSSTRELVEDDLPDGVLLRDLGLHRLKDVNRPERISQIAAEGLRADFPQLRTGQRRRRIDRRLIPVVVVLGVGALIGGLLLTRGQAGSAQAAVGVAADSVGAFQSRSGRLVAQKRVGTGPGSVAAGAGAVWVVNVDSKSVSRVDPKTNNVTQTVTVGSGPAGLAVGRGFVWFANSLDGTLSKIDPRSNGGTPVDVIPVGNQPAGVAYGLGSVWASVLSPDVRYALLIHPAQAVAA